MVRREKDMKAEKKEQLRGGDGSVVMTEILSKEELMGHGRLYSLITIEPGCSIGTHDHTHEAEFYYIVKGTFTAEDNGKPVTLNPGDMMATGGGHTHSIRNTGGETGRLVALILNGETAF